MPNHSADCSAAGEFPSRRLPGQVLPGYGVHSRPHHLRSVQQHRDETCFPNSFRENGYCNDVAGGFGAACSGGEDDTCSNDIVCRGGTCCDPAVASVRTPGSIYHLLFLWLGR